MKKLTVTLPALATLACALCAAPALCATAQVPVPGQWKGVSKTAPHEFTLQYSATADAAGLGGYYEFSSGGVVLQGRFKGALLRRGVYSIELYLPAGASLPGFGLLFPEMQKLSGTLDCSLNEPVLRASFEKFPDMALAATMRPSADGKAFSASWVALGRAGTAVFRRLETPARGRK